MNIPKDAQHDHLLAQEQMSHLTNYYGWSLSFIEKFLGQRIWDAGAGVGHTACTLYRNADFVLLTEFGEENLQHLRSGFKDVDGIHIGFCDLLQADGRQYLSYKLDTIISLDVVEHLQDDRHAFQVFYDALQPGGHILIKAPAHPFLFCGIDQASLHYRRYTRKGLRSRAEAAGFEILLSRYMNAPGALLYLLNGRILKKKMNFSRTFSTKKLARMNRWIPFFRVLERTLPFPFGLSTVVVARKPD